MQFSFEQIEFGHVFPTHQSRQIFSYLSLGCDSKTEFEGLVVVQIGAKLDFSTTLFEAVLVYYTCSISRCMYGTKPATKFTSATTSGLTISTEYASSYIMYDVPRS